MYLSWVIPRDENVDEVEMVVPLWCLVRLVQRFPSVPQNRMRGLSVRAMDLVNYLVCCLVHKRYSSYWLYVDV